MLKLLVFSSQVFFLVSCLMVQATLSGWRLYMYTILACLFSCVGFVLMIGGVYSLDDNGGQNEDIKNLFAVRLHQRQARPEAPLLG